MEERSDDQQPRPARLKRAGAQGRRGRRARALVAGVVLALVVAEAGLRLVSFSYQFYPERIEFGWPGPDVIADGLRVDRDLFWVPRDYDAKLARALARRPSIAFMGCSCTAQGRYDTCLEELIAERFPQERFSCANFGVAGWSTHQGLRQLERDVVKVKPRVVTLYYGWNDHWVGFGIEDKDVTTMNSSIWFTLQQKSRLAQLVAKAAIGVFTRRGDGPPLRVSPEDFRANLRAMVRLARAHGIIPVLLTAPTSHRRGREPAHLAERHLRNLEELVPLHQQYVSIVRDVANTESVVLCDLAAGFDKLPNDVVRTEYFHDDGIHLRHEGDERIAEFLFRCFEQDDLFKEILR